MKNSVKKLVKIALLSAISIILFYISFPLFPWAPFLKLDLSMTPTLFAGFAISPWAAVVVMLIKNAIFLPISNTGMIGELADFIIGSAFAFTAASAYHYKKDRKHALIGLGLGSVTMIVFAVVFNYFVFLPLFMSGMDSKARLDMIATTILPFNAIKCVAVSLVTFVLYKRLSWVLHK